MKVRYNGKDRVRILQPYIKMTSITEVQSDCRIHFQTRISPSEKLNQVSIENLWIPEMLMTNLDSEDLKQRELNMLLTEFL